MASKVNMDVFISHVNSLRIHDRAALQKKLEDSDLKISKATFYTWLRRSRTPKPSSAAAVAKEMGWKPSVLFPLEKM